MIFSRIEPLPHPFMQRRAFSAIEMLLTLGVIAVTAGVSVPLYRNFQIKNDLDLAVAQTIHGLTRAQLLSQTGDADGTWGFRIPEGTVFFGESYAVRDDEYDEVVVLPPGITVFGIEEVVFARVTGEPSVTGDIILEAQNGERRTISVSDQGVLIASDVQQGTVSGETAGDTSGESETGGGSEDSGDTGNDDSGGDGGTTGDTGDTGGSGETGGSGGSGGSGGASCEDRFSISANGAIETTGTVQAKVKVLGSSITYGAGGPEVQVDVSASTDNGDSYTKLFGGDDVDGGEEETIGSLTSGEKLVLKVHGRYGWLFNKTFKSNDSSGHIEVLKNGDDAPDYQAFDNQQNLATFLNTVIGDDGKISIGEYDVVLLVELGSLNSSSSDFQDAVILVSFEQVAGSCAESGEPAFKIEFERLENSGSGDAKKKSFVGPTPLPYGDGQWIPLLASNGQVATDVSLVEDVKGLSVQRKNGYVRVLLHGSHEGTGNKEIVDTRITFRDAKVMKLVNDTTDNNAAENPFDGVVNDGAGGDEADALSGSGSVFFQTRVTGEDDAILVYWQQGAPASSSSSSSAGGGSSGSNGSSGSDDDDDGNGDDDDGVTDNEEDAGSTDDDDGDGDDDDGVAGSDDKDDVCKANFTVSDGKITLGEKADVTFKVLGSHALYSKGGPKIQVRLSASTDGGATWKQLYNYRDIRGGDSQTLRDIAAGKTVLLRAEGRRGWLFSNTARTDDGSGRMKLLQRGNAVPNTNAFKQIDKLESFLKNVLTKGKVSIVGKEVLALVELRDATADADFQDAVVVITVEKPLSGGVCGTPDAVSSASAGATSSAASNASSGSNVSAGSAGSATSSSSAAPGDFVICHFPPGNPRNNQTLTVSPNAWDAHEKHGDRKGACESDEDGDGITTSVDLCPGTYVPEGVPKEGLSFDKYALTHNEFAFRVGPQRKVSDYTLEDTKGCSCEQIIDVAEGLKTYRFDQYPSLLRDIKGLFPFYTEGARRSGCGKAVLKMVKKAN